MTTSNKSAIVDVLGELLPIASRALLDKGLRIVGSAKSDMMIMDTVRLIVEGDSLPEACRDHTRLVQIQMVQKIHGEQRIVTIEEIKVIDELRQVSNAWRP